VLAARPLAQLMPARVPTTGQEMGACSARGRLRPFCVRQSGQIILRAVYAVPTVADVFGARTYQFSPRKT